MKKIIEILCISLCLLVSLCACTIKSDKKMSDEEIQKLKSEYVKYLSETYPEETFTVDVWQEYSETTGGAGLPDYEGYLLRQVITDSEGNRFKIFTKNIGEYSDDYQEVLNGTIHYNEKGQRVFFDENGEVLFTSD